MLEKIRIWIFRKCVNLAVDIIFHRRRQMALILGPVTRPLEELKRIQSCFAHDLNLIQERLKAREAQIDQLESRISVVKEIQEEFASLRTSLASLDGDQRSLAYQLADCRRAIERSETKAKELRKKAVQDLRAEQKALTQRVRLSRRALRLSFVQGARVWRQAIKVARIAHRDQGISSSTAT